MPTVLLVDNDAIIREPIAAVLAARGCDVLCAGGAYEALDILNAYEIDLLVLEVDLKEIHGITILSRMLDDPRQRDVPVILVTRCVDSELLAQARALGVRHILLKPQFALDTFLSRVTTVLGGRAAVSGEGGNDAPIPARSDAVADVVSTAEPDHQPEDKNAQTNEPMRQRHRSWADSLHELHELKPLLSKEESKRRLESCPDLGAFSPAVTKLLKLTGSENATAQQVSRALRQDHSIALRILKLANSSMYSRGEPVESLEKAVLRIGMGQIRQVLLSIAVIDSFASEDFEGCIDFGLFWEHSIGSGIVAAALAESRSEEVKERAFTMGLVHNVGRLMLARALSEEFAEAVSVADNCVLPLHVVEAHLLGLDHAECMDHLLRRWRFPKEFIDPIVRHHVSIADARKRNSEEISEFAILALAHRLCQALLIGDDGEGTLSATEAFCEELKLPGDLLEKIAEAAIDETADVKLALLAQIKDSKWTDSLSLVHEGLQRPIRTAYCSVRPEFDAFAFFFRRIDDEESRENLSVVRVTSPGDFGKLKFQLAEQEKKVGQRLPLLVICSDDSVGCPPEMLDGRAHAIVHEPVGIRHITATIRDLVANATLVASAA